MQKMSMRVWMPEVYLSAFLLQLLAGCGGSFNKLFADFKLVKYDWGEMHCSWKISNLGLQYAIMLISAHIVQFKSCSEYSRIFSSSGSELSHYSRCRYGHHNGNGVIGELVEAPFNGSSFLTAKVKLYNEGSVVRSEFTILEAGKGLGSDPTHPPRSFHHEFISADTLKLTWDSIPEEHHNGDIIGYTIWYRAGCEHNYMSPEVRINVSVSTTSYTLTALQPGTKYDLWIAGFTAAGIGHDEHRDLFTSCAGPFTLTNNNATIQSPGYPCGFGGVQRCRWSIRPGGPVSAIWIFFEEFSLSFHNHEFPYCR